MQKRYSPWRKQKLRAYLALAVCLAVFCGIFFYGVPLPFLLISVICFGIWKYNISKASNREFGKQFEEYWVTQATTILMKSGYTVKTNSMYRGLGDIDLIVYSSNKSCIPIEIKSFIKWNTFLFFFLGSREKKAIKQSERQKQRLGSNISILWLPQGRQGLIDVIFGYRHVGEGIVLVKGNANALRSYIRKVI